MYKAIYKLTSQLTWGASICKRCEFRFFRISASRLNHTDVRVRFAPSPTGDLHLGGVRTALYNYLYAKKYNGKFILRCEDTDQTRYVPGVMDKLIDLLQWMGIRLDEGPNIGGSYGSYVQSERLDLYKKWVEHLMEQGHAYRCFCSSQRLELLRKEQVRRRETFQGYDNLCRHLSPEKLSQKLSAGDPYVIRFKMTNEPQGWTDLVYGEMNSDLTQVEGDPVIMKSDGYPTYHLANVVDDHFMNITHVLRGAEWQSSTAKHLQLFAAFGWSPPQYAHLPLLLNPDGTKLSKRQASLKLEHLREQGYAPEGIIAMLSLSGGGISLTHDDINNNGVNLIKAVEKFRLDNIRTENTVLPLHRLPALNQAFIQRTYRAESKDSFLSRITEMASKQELLLLPDLDLLYHKFPKYVERLSTWRDLFEGDFSFLWQRPCAERVRDALQSVKGCTKDDCIRLMTLLDSSRGGAVDIRHDDFLKDLQAQTNLKKSTFFKILRVTFVGGEAGPPIAMVLDLLSEEEIITRVANALSSLTLAGEDICHS